MNNRKIAQEVAKKITDEFILKINNIIKNFISELLKEGYTEKEIGRILVIYKRGLK